MIDLNAGADLTIAQMCDVLGLPAKLWTKPKAGVITARKLDILSTNVQRKERMTGDRQDTILWDREPPILRTGRSKNGMMIMLGVLDI